MNILIHLPDKDVCSNWCRLPLFNRKQFFWDFSEMCYYVIFVEKTGDNSEYWAEYAAAEEN